MPRNGNKATSEQRKWKASQKYVETHGKWIINTSHKLGSVRPIDLVSRNPDRLREFESKEAAVAFEEECHQEAEKLKAAGKDWSHYRYIPRKKLTIQAKPDAAMPVLRDVRKEELINDWNDTEVGEADTYTVSKPKWLGTLTKMASSK